MIWRTKLHLADALGQAALQFSELASLFAIVVTAHGPVAEFAVVPDQIAGTIVHVLSSFYRASASI